MYLHILGSSGSYPTPGRPASGYLIEQGPTRVWCDAGPGTFLALAETIDVSLITAIVLSHSHPDHCSDLLTAFHTFAYGQPRRERVPVLAPREVWDRMCAFLASEGEDAFHRTFTFDPVSGGDRRQVGELEVTFTLTDHSVPTVASRWSDGQRVMAYSADTGPSGDWMNVAEGANLFLCEATYQDGQAPEYPHHLTASQAGIIARSHAVQVLMITHVPAYLDGSLSVEEAESTFGRPVALAVPGTRHKV